MFRHTHRRPRDILAQMQAVIVESRKRQEFPNISIESVRVGVHDDAVLQQILGDALTPYEGTLPIELIDAARSVFYERSRVMTGRELNNFAMELFNLYPIPNIKPEKFVNALLRCGVIGFLGESKHGKPQNYNKPNKEVIYRGARFEYGMQSHIPLSNRFYYCVHPVMGDVFDMSHGKDEYVIYPLPDKQDGTWLEEEAGIVLDLT